MVEHKLVNYFHTVSINDDYINHCIPHPQSLVFSLLLPLPQIKLEQFWYHYFHQLYLRRALHFVQKKQSKFDTLTLNKNCSVHALLCTL